jgi:hypothetical protein
LVPWLKHLLADEWDKRQAQKRGGGVIKTFNLEDAEARYHRQLCHDLPPKAGPSRTEGRRRCHGTQNENSCPKKLAADPPLENAILGVA